MPELPEVETIARQLRGLVVDRTIRDFESRWIRLTDPEPAEVVAARLRGRRITGVRRRGKFVVFDLDGGDALVVSLRMTGKLLYGVDGVDERYVRGQIHFVGCTKRSAGRSAKGSAWAARHAATTWTRAAGRDGCSASSRSTVAPERPAPGVAVRSCARSSRGAVRSTARTVSARPAANGLRGR